MSDCCQDAECCGGEKKNILFYACSGGANVGEVADRAAREMMYAGCGTMFCLAGLGAGIESMIETAKKADMNIVIDGCGVDCAKKLFDNCGVTNMLQIKVTDLGIEKVKGVKATDEQVATVVARVKEILTKL
jgi:uncharacterized metal-binding protein